MRRLFLPVCSRGFTPALWEVVSWGQQQGVVAGGVGEDLAVVVDRGRVLDLVAGPGRDQVVEVCTVPPLSIEGLPAMTPLSLIAAGRKRSGW